MYIKPLVSSKKVLFCGFSLNLGVPGSMYGQAWSVGVGGGLMVGVCSSSSKSLCMSPDP